MQHIYLNACSGRMRTKFILNVNLIEEAERKWVPKTKEAVTNRKSPYLKFRHV